MRKFYLILTLFMLFSFAKLKAQQILVWDYSGSYTIPNPDQPEEYQIEDAIITALEANDISPTVVYILPDDLSEFDAVFVLGGIWCYS